MSVAKVEKTVGYHKYPLVGGATGVLAKMRRPNVTYTIELAIYGQLQGTGSVRIS